MRNAILIILIVAVAAVLWLPPVFTGGACTAEFEAVSAMLEHARAGILTLPQAQQYLSDHGIVYQVLTAERCEAAPPPNVTVCPGGPVLLGAVPVRNRICHYYRDANVRFQLGFNRLSQLVRIQTDMNPYQMLKLPFGLELDMGK